MGESFVVLSAVLPVFCIIGLGGLLRRANWLTEEADRSILRVTINVLVPFLILDSTLGNQALHQLGNLLLAPLAGIATALAGFFLAHQAASLAGLREARQRRTFALAAGLYNYGYVPIPLAFMLYGQETVGVLFVHNVGVEAALWTAGLALLKGAPPGREWHRIFNLPLLAIVVGQALNLSGGDQLVPQFMLSIFKMLGQCAIPMGMILIGATIADEIHEFHSQAAWRTMGVACLLRQLILPAFFLLLARWLPCSLELKRVILLQAAMPAAVFPVVMAKHYDGDTATALRVVISSSALSLVTTPLWIRLGTHFLF